MKKLGVDAGMTRTRDGPMLLICLLASVLSVRALQPAPGFSLYEFTSLWYKMAVVTKGSVRPAVGYSCATADYDCYPRHCDPDSTTLSVTANAVNAVTGRTLNSSEGFADCLDADAPGRRGEPASDLNQSDPPPERTNHSFVQLCSGLPRFP